MLRWPADDDLNELIRRYYAGEAGLWESIRRRIDDELRQRLIERGAYHIRLRARADGGYDVQIDDAADYANPI
jgi:hypothetical protein